MSGSTLTITLTDVDSNEFEVTTAGKNMLQGKAYQYAETMPSIDVDDTPYVTFTADAEQNFQMSSSVSTLEYSVNDGNWTELGTTQVIFGGSNGDLRLRGKSSGGTSGSKISFGNATKVACSGDIRTLVDYENYDTANTSQAFFRELFEDCVQLTSAPDLTAKTLASYFYVFMFYGCSSLTAAPDLPATTLANTCYEHMFEGCTSLTQAPELPATNVAEWCYEHMFEGCTSLTLAPDLPATTLASFCYASMFQGCTSLTRAPELPAEVLKSGCYSAMFYGCSELNYIKMMATDISASNCLDNWVYGVSSTGTFVKNSAATWEDFYGRSGIPTGWTVQTADE